jgi:cell wall-associated NlpC family hydrolase
MKYLFILLLLISGCSTTHSDIAPQDNNAEQMNNLAIYAISLYDTPYHSGGTSRTGGFDCSGFVRYVYQNSAGMTLPRTSAEMSRIGMELKIDQLKPGDLVFFNTQHSPFSHVGIFVGDHRFVHSPSSGRAIMMSNMNEHYWRARYNGARRINLKNTLAVAQ